MSSTGELPTQRRPTRKRTQQRPRWDPRSRGSVHLPSDADRAPLEECDELLSVIRQVAGRQRRLAQSADLAIIGASASIPVFLLLSTQYLDFYLGKLVPALLAALAAALALLLKLTRPHERWRLLRFHQALLEAERFRYLHGLDDYAGKDRDIHLLTQVVKTNEEIAGAWFELMPESAKVAQLLQSGDK